MLRDVGANHILGEITLSDQESRFDRLMDSATVGLLRDMRHPGSTGPLVYASIGSRSLPAIKAFLRGEELYRRMDLLNAQRAYEEAVGLDSSFAPALRKLGVTVEYLSFGAGYALSGPVLERATRNNKGLGARDSLLIRLESLWNSPSDAFDICDQLTKRYADDAEVWDYCGNVVLGRSFYTWQRQQSFSAQDIRGFYDRAITLDSFNVDALQSSAQLSIFLGDLDAARLRLHQCLRVAPPGTGRSTCALFLAFLEHPNDASRWALDTVPRWAQAQLFFAYFGLADSAETQVSVARHLVNRTEVAPLFFNTGAYLATALAIRGHLAEAWSVASRRETQDFFGVADQIAALGAVSSDSVVALLHRSVPNFEFREGCRMWWSLASEDTVEIGKVRDFGRALLHRPTPSNDRRNELSFFENDLSLFDSIATARLRLARGDTNTALPALLSIQDRQPMLCKSLVGRLLVARAFAAKGKLDEAARWLGHSSLVEFALGPFNVMWRLQRARVAERMGNRTQAVDDYWYVAHMWQHADSVLQPYVAESRAALARLRSDR
jgi:serine/threonine-protein kinase